MTRLRLNPDLHGDLPRHRDLTSKQAWRVLRDRVNSTARAPCSFRLGAQERRLLFGIARLPPVATAPELENWRPTGRASLASDQTDRDRFSTRRIRCDLGEWYMWLMRNSTKQNCAGLSPLAALVGRLRLAAAPAVVLVDEIHTTADTLPAPVAAAILRARGAGRNVALVLSVRVHVSIVATPAHVGLLERQLSLGADEQILDLLRRLNAGGNQLVPLGVEDSLERRPVIHAVGPECLAEGD